MASLPQVSASSSSAPVADDCLEPSDVMALAEGELAPQDRVRAFRHLDECAACRSLVAVAAAGSESTAMDPDATLPQTPPKRSDDPRVGDHVDRYVIEGMLGAGGMGCVYLARHVHLDRQVALKLIRPGRTLKKQEVGRFRREAQVLASIDDPHVVRVYDFGLHHGTPFLAMERLEGRTLDELIGEQPMTVPRATNIAAQVLSGLSAVHRAGIVHRDIKPSNVLVTVDQAGREQVKLLDFGVSKMLGASTFTESGALVGTPAYMAPEQILAPQKVGAHTDIYAVSVLLYRLLTGRMPYDADTLEELIRVFAGSTPRPGLGTLRERVPEPLVEAIGRGLSLTIEERFGSAAEYEAALARAPSADEQSGVRRPISGQPEDMGTTQPTPARFGSAPVGARPGSARPVALLAVAIGLIVMALALPWLWREFETSPQGTVWTAAPGPNTHARRTDPEQRLAPVQLTPPARTEPPHTVTMASGAIEESPPAGAVGTRPVSRAPARRRARTTVDTANDSRPVLGPNRSPIVD